MKKEWASYILYKSYKIIAAVFIVIFLNFFSSWLIDLFVGLFGGLPELQGLVATLALTIVVSAALFAALFYGALRFRSRIFSSVPEKPCAVPVKHEGQEHRDSSAVCRCACGTSRDMLGTVRFQLPDKEEALLSMNVVKRPDGSGLLRSDCKVAGKTQSVAFRINFCPHCGGRFVTEDQAVPALTELVTRPAPVTKKKRTSKHFA